MPSTKSLLILFGVVAALVAIASLRGGSVWYRAMGLGFLVAAGCAVLFVGSMAIAIGLIKQAGKKSTRVVDEDRAEIDKNSSTD